MSEVRWKPLPMARRPTTAGGLPRALLDAEGRRRRRAIVRAALALALVALPACGILAARADAAARPPAPAPAVDRGEVDVAPALLPRAARERGGARGPVYTRRELHRPEPRCASTASALRSTSSAPRRSP